MIAAPAAAIWARQGYDTQRSMYNSEPATHNPNSSSTVMIECGTDTDSHNVAKSQGLFAAIADDDARPDLLLMCGADTSNPNPHMIMINDDIVQVDSITLTGTSLDSNDLPVAWSICEYDNSAETNEICIVNNDEPVVTNGFQHFSILIYTFNKTSQEFSKLKEWYLNSTGTEINLANGTTINGSNLGTADYNARTLIDCNIPQSSDDTMCYITSGTAIFATNFTTNNTVEWWYEGEWTTADDLMTQSTYDPTVYDDDGIYRINTTYGVKFINLTTGAMEREFTLPGISEAAYFGIVDCDASDCDPDAYEIVVADGANNEVSIFSAEDGSLLQATQLSNSGDSSAYAWVEDRDGDGNQELCGVMIDNSESGSDDSYVKCEELNLFEFDTLDTAFGLDTGADYFSSSSIVRADFDNDGLDDLMVGTTIIYLGSETDTVSAVVIDSLNSSFVQGGDAGQVYSVANIYSLYDQYLNGTGTFLTTPISPANNDTVWLTTSGALPDTGTQPDLVQLDNGPVQSIQNPICNNSTVTFECTYDNGCAVDEDYTNFGVCYDCFNNGTQADCMTANEFFLNYDEWECDLTGASTGLTSMYIEVFETGYEDNNDSMLYNYTIASSACYDDGNNSGEVDVPDANLPPESVGIPTSTVPEPYCLNSTIIFECSEGDCWTDDENDSVFLVPDCDGDGVYEAGGALGDDRFYCIFRTAGSHTVGLKICDTVNSHCGSVAFSAVVSTQTVEDIITDNENPVCYTEYIFDPEEGEYTVPDSVTGPVITNGIIPKFPTGRPYCFNDFIRFNCVYGTCYYTLDDSILTFADIDETTDGVTDRNTALGLDHNFSVTFSSDDYPDGHFHALDSIFEFNITYTLINEIGQSDTAVYAVNVSNDTTLCALQGDLAGPETGEEAEEKGGVYNFFYDIGQVFNLSPSNVGYIFLIIGAVSMFWGGVSYGLPNPAMVSVGFFVMGTVILALNSVIGAIIPVIFAVLAIGWIAWRGVGTPST